MLSCSHVSLQSLLKVSGEFPTSPLEGWLLKPLETSYEGGGCCDSEELDAIVGGGVEKRSSMAGQQWTSWMLYSWSSALPTSYKCVAAEHVEGHQALTAAPVVWRSFWICVSTLYRVLHMDVFSQYKGVCQSLVEIPRPTWRLRRQSNGLPFLA